MASNPDRGEILLTELQVRAAGPAGAPAGGAPGKAGPGVGGTLRTAPLAPLSAETLRVSVRSRFPTPGTRSPARYRGPPGGGTPRPHGRGRVLARVPAWCHRPALPPALLPNSFE